MIDWIMLVAAELKNERVAIITQIKVIVLQLNFVFFTCNI